MSSKIYETIGVLNRHTQAVIDGNVIPIHFVNGTDSPKRMQGRYMTANPKIQEFLEASPAFNVRWRLVSETKDKNDVEPKKVAEPPVDENDDLAHTPDSTPSPDPVEDDTAALPISVPEVTDEDFTPEPEYVNPTTPTIVGKEVSNGQQARNYLMEHVKGITFRQVANNQQIISVAKENNIQFTDWEAFVTSK